MNTLFSLAFFAIPAAAQTVAVGDRVAPLLEQCEVQSITAPANAIRAGRALMSQPSLSPDSQARALACILQSQQGLGDMSGAAQTRTQLVALIDTATLSMRVHNGTSLSVSASLQQSGKAAEALAIMEGLLADPRNARDLPLRIDALMGCANVYAIQLREPQQAVRYLEQAIALARQIGLPDSPGDVLLHYNYGYALLQLQRYDDAEREFQTAESVGKHVQGVEPLLQRIAGSRAQIALAQGDAARARTLLEPVLAWQRRTGDLAGLVVSQQRMARVELAQGHPEQALALASSAQREATTARLADEIHGSLVLLADISTARGDTAAAADYRAQATTFAQQQSGGQVRAQLARVQAHAGQPTNAALAAMRGRQHMRHVWGAIAVALALLVLGVAYILHRARKMRRPTAGQAGTDALTGLPDRQAGTQQLQALLAGDEATHMTAGRRGIVLLLQLDSLPSIVADHGHQAGQALVQAAAVALRQACDEQDLLVRWADAVFVIARQASTEQPALALAEHLRTTLERTVVALDDGLRVPVTASIGMAACPFFPSTAGRWQDSLALAEDAAATAQHAGGNAWAALWGLHAGPGMPMAEIRQDPHAAQTQGQIALHSSRPMAWMRGDDQPTAAPPDDAPAAAPRADGRARDTTRSLDQEPV